MRFICWANEDFGKRLAIAHRGHRSQTKARNRIQGFIFFLRASFHVV